MDFTLPVGIGSVISGKNPANSISYHETGKILFVASEGDSRVQVIDCLTGKPEQLSPLRAEREQANIVEATHHEHTVLIGGKGTSPTQPIGQRFAISYWSLHDNKILRKFRGHSGQVTSMSTCPADDTFLSSSSDGSVRLWDLKQAGCVAELKLPNDSTGGPPLAAFDSTGLVFCTAAPMSNNAGHYVNLYDARNYGGGAFAEMKVQQADIEKAALAASPGLDANRAGLVSRAPFQSIQFNLSGSSILANNTKGMTLVIDGFEGTIQNVFVDSKKDGPAVACFTADEKTVLTGADDGSVSCYDVSGNSGSMVKRLEGHPGPISCIATNPQYAQFASACSQIALWVW